MQFITGNKGFVGQNLSNYLKKEKKITIGISRNPTKDDKSYSTLTLEDFNNAKSFIHLAGKAHDLKNTSEDKEYFEVNTELTKTLFDQFLKSECEVFIYMSSVKAAADNVEDQLTEEVIPSPITAYGKSKLAAENYILSKEIQEGKRVYILRPCMIHGPNNKGNLNLLYSFVSKGIPYPFGKYENKRSFVSVENLCFIINELIDNVKISSGIYNIADDTPLSTVNLVEIIGEIVGKPAEILKVSKFLVNILAKIGDILPLPINSEKLQKLTENYTVSNTKIKKAIQKELPLTTQKGLEKTIASF
ncbi:NAD-dependent epimerase/dehydratase family protein [Polaribacter dokdonensis]|uniref:NAD-dependent epimerase/dehydratase n=1 Tax=Polaribacter dokdonensis DSW-5 TaxID=1300348 RepID=A0A0N0CEM5_9FLAO|nr:NAD-dependent epimerase/dehydratase family protein [Polaribacter dokdonensis]KOY50650.1 NAD-dependent epimerase/dehydratase [Polaribacter dokdonensis DSW-5]SEE62233.1 Nucleoside-diphosphate-sugar epimerase [Polaribacter dokdonensis DSW-5]